MKNFYAIMQGRDIIAVDTSISPRALEHLKLKAVPIFQDMYIALKDAFECIEAASMILNARDEKSEDEFTEDELWDAEETILRATRDLYY